ncbi:Protein CBG18379 [Caenorhabditis briggsae]|nr:Protein CBG18379 [Caenorhabditis briggsae]CAP35845.2 Protein CBG18379 [Caenorhabditis briggsae]
MYYVDSSLNHFYWSFYQYVMEFSSKVPSQWTFIGDDQTYLIVPNLRNVLHNFDSEKPVVLGKVRDTSTFFSWLFPLSSFKKISVRGGIVFSNSAIDKLSACKGFFFARASDYALYDCSDSHNVQIADPFDEDALRLFNDLPPKQIIAPDSKLFRTSSMKGGKCSDHAVSFGQLSEKDMRVLEYGMTLKVFGRGGLETSESNETTTT